MRDTITVEAHIHAPLTHVWDAYTDPRAIEEWNAAAPTWHTRDAQNDLRVGGRFSCRMEAKDGSEGFEFEGVYSQVALHERIAYTMDDGRKVEIVFSSEPNGVCVTETFEPETENTHELQRAGWQAILENFKKYCERL